MSSFSTQPFVVRMFRRMIRWVLRLGLMLADYRGQQTVAQIFCCSLAFGGVSRFGLAVRRVRLLSRRTSVQIRFGSPFFSKVVVCGHRLVTLSLTINKTLIRLSLLPILMQDSFWWWQCSNRYIIYLFPHLHTPLLLHISNKPYLLLLGWKERTATVVSKVSRFYWAFIGSWGLESEVTFAHDVPYEQVHEFY